MGRIVALGEYHGIPESVDRLRDVIRKNGGSHYRHEAICGDYRFIEAAQLFSAGRYNSKELNASTYLQELWGPSEHYVELWDAIYNVGGDLRGLDQTADRRIWLAREYVMWIEDLKEGYKGHVNRAVWKFNRLHHKLSPEREAHFAHEIAATASNGDDVGVTAIMHVGHVKRVVARLKRMGLGPIEVNLPSSAEQKGMSKLEDELQDKFYEQQEVLTMHTPPLVPAVAHAYIMSAKLKRN